MTTDQEQAFARFADFREDETPAMLSNVYTLDGIEEQEESKPWLRKLLLAVPLLFACFCFWQALPDSVTSPQTAQALTAAAPSQPQRQLITRRIDQIQPGHRVLAENPDVEDGQPDTLIIPGKWSLISLQLTNEDESQVFVELLRPTKYLTSIHAATGESIWIDLPEMGVSGAATIVDVSPCPELEPGEGRLVTGTFRHTSGDIIDLQIEGQQTPVSCTGNHPFWSEDRQEFIEASSLQQGEQLRKADGSLTRLISITNRETLADVYNLEVDIDHTYFVGATGILVHNNYVYEGWKNGKRYVGITNNLTRRGKQHAKLGRRIAGLDHLDNLTRREARAVEQVLINRYGLGNLDNKINSVGINNPWYDEAIGIGNSILDGLGF